MYWGRSRKECRGMKSSGNGRGSVTEAAIAEAVALAQRIFVDYAVEYGQESVPA